MLNDFADDMGDPDRNRRARVMNRIAHLLPGILVLYVGVTALGAVATIGMGMGWLPRSPEGGGSDSSLGADLLGWAFVLCLVGPILLAMLHVDYARICVRCMRSVPEDAPLRAATRRKRLWLRTHHRLRGWRMSVSLLALMIVSTIVDRVWDAPAVSGAFTLIIVVGIGAVIWSNWIHHRYRPWCPWCRRWDDGGHHEHSPDPVDNGEKVA